MRKMNKTLNNMITQARFRTAMLIMAMVAFYGCETDDTQTVARSTNVVWEDNFDIDGAPDANRWGFDLGDGSDEGIPGWGHEGLQYYKSMSDTVTIPTGVLLITSRCESF